MQFHAAGKVSLDHIYTQPDPRAYFTTLRTLEYQIPQLAKAHFGRLVQELRETRRVRRATVLDVGCSYGINAALLRCGATMNDLYDRYCGYDASVERSTLLARDRQWTRAHTHPDRLRILGLDVSSEALAYAVASGLLDDAVNADLENGEVTEHHVAQHGLRIDTQARVADQSPGGPRVGGDQTQRPAPARRLGRRPAHRLGGTLRAVHPGHHGTSAAACLHPILLS